MAKVSIIIPIYNVEKYVRRTIESAIKQTERDIEIILVNDGSTDSSGDICNGYASKDTRIKIIHKENGGLSSARNAGIKEASSEYVLLLDGDDYLANCAVETLLKIMEKYPSDLIQFRYQEVFENETPNIGQNKETIYQAHTSEELFENLYEIGGMAASGCTKLFKKDMLLKIPFITIRHEDEMWCTQAFQNPLTVTYIPNILYYYVMREESIIHSRFNVKKLDVFVIIEERIKTLRQLSLNQFLRNEYQRMYISILGLYCEAAEAKNQEALEKIKKQFIENRKNIKKYANLQGKFKILFALMSFNYYFVNMYRKGKKSK